MPDILFAAETAGAFRRLSPAHRQWVRHELQKNHCAEGHPRAKRIYSDVLNTTLYMIRSPDVRFFYELKNGHVIVLSLHKINASPHEKTRARLSQKAKSLSSRPSPQRTGK